METVRRVCTYLVGRRRTIVGVLVTHVGSDMGSVTPMLDQIHPRTGALARLKHHHGVAHVLGRALANVTCVAFLAALAANLVSHTANLIGSVAGATASLVGGA